MRRSHNATSSYKFQRVPYLVMGRLASLFIITPLKIKNVALHLLAEWSVHAIDIIFLVF